MTPFASIVNPRILELFDVLADHNLAHALAIFYGILVILECAVATSRLDVSSLRGQTYRVFPTTSDIES